MSRHSLPRTRYWLYRCTGPCGPTPPGGSPGSRYTRRAGPGRSRTAPGHHPASIQCQTFEQISKPQTILDEFECLYMCRINLKSTVQSSRLSDWNHQSFEPICDDGGFPLLPASDGLPQGASDHHPGHHLHPPLAGLAEAPEHPGVTLVRTGNR